MSEPECPYGNIGCSPKYHGYYDGTKYEGYYRCEDCQEDHEQADGGDE